MSKPNLTFEVSSGGFVLNQDDPSLIALMARFNRAGKLEWCIPKGHPEANESDEEAAIREVFEETGLKAEIIEKIGQLKYQFSQSGQKISKTVQVFLMQQVGGELSMEFDPHHEASDLAWVKLDRLVAKLSHGNEKKIAEKAIEMIRARS